MGYQACLLARQRSWNSKHAGSDLLQSWAHQERLSPRFVTSAGPWDLVAAYAPTALEEFHILYNSQLPTSLNSLSPRDWTDLAGLVVSIQRFWKHRGFNSGHMTLFGSTQGIHAPFGRLMLRSTYSPWYRSDQSCYEIGCWEAARDILPESLAQLARTSPTWERPTAQP